ncbi:FG-GAP-like repeat-containing protein [Flagellimonas ochracea]|uniref:FG-GAP-like repeat-containing protein n=1 Tax=Flagellimonas ochracea TaxID=2696472 RepID=UPI001AA1794D|nr:FG-GAP-like repeat-containing protein [Allomuricauda ochracea]
MVSGHRLLFSFFFIFLAHGIHGQAYFERSSVFSSDGEVGYGQIATFHGPGISFVDYDGDGWDDITIPSSSTKDFQFLKNTGGLFAVQDLPISSNGLQSRQVTWVDFDNDGDNDFFATSDLGRCWFYRNDGNNNFTDILESSNIASPSWAYWGVAWGDYDNDGYLDAFLMVRASVDLMEHNLLYHNNGDGTFTDVTDSAGLHLTGKMTQSASFFDYDRDGFQDIILANDKDLVQNVLYKNNGDGTFQDVSILSNMDLEMDGMSTTISDYDNDGFLDVYITNIYPPDLVTSVFGNAFMKNNGDGTFTNIAQSNGTRFDSFGWGAVFLDSENDGDLDLFVNGHLDGTDDRISSAYYENDGNGDYFVPESNGFEDDMASSYGNAIGDIQNDGLPDLVVVNLNDEPLDVWRNKSVTQNNWLKIKLVGTDSNRMGIGSYIKIGIGGQTFYRYTLCGEGYIGQNSSYEFVGLGSATSVDYVEVTWLSGIVDLIENIDANQAITITEGSNAIEVDDNHGNGSNENESEHSVARQWNEVLLNAIRWDFARPTVHARNLFHTSMAMYDAWAIFEDKAETVFLGKTFGGYSCEFEGIVEPADVEDASEEIMSYAMYRLLNHRFAESPGATATLQITNNLFSSLGYDSNMTSTDYSSGSYAALGNYLAEQLISFGLNDGSNESNGYENEYYNPVNQPLELDSYQEPFALADPNRWQPLKFESFVDQSGNLITGNTPEFLSPEWGEVTPFALREADLAILQNDFDSYIYNDPGAPPEIQMGNGIEDPYKWHFALVASWSSHLDPNDPTEIDISPASIGNVGIENYPNTFSEYQTFYNFMEGGDISTGHPLNPYTQQPYEPQMVKRADYARVLAEFWADGPDSETPPGHWFTILNYVSDHPETVKYFGGNEPLSSDLEWDVKSYLALGGAMHDAAVTTWGVKGYYDYIRPISAIRYMASKGQSTNAALPSYNPHGLPLIPGRIELIETGDPLAGPMDENVNKVKILGWKGPDFISDPTMDVAGVDWILGTHWWPYQRPTFVTPPFAGYVSGHSTFSRAAAEVLTLITGDAFFPGGMGIFDIEQNNFLVFEQGPSENLTLQWATYRDASDQTSLSRIWGGIHPPIDDIPGRLMGEKIGKESFSLAQEYYEGLVNFGSDNFLIEINGETCVDKNDGSITIIPKDYYNYSANLDGQEFTFTTEFTISDLAPGEHHLCLGVQGNDNIEQCYNIVVSEATQMTTTTELKAVGESITASIDIEGGTPPYILEINDSKVGEFENRQFSTLVKNGDVLQVYSKLRCEGIYSETIDIENRPILYSNPTSYETIVRVGEGIGKISISIYSINGQFIRSDNYEISNGEIKIPVDDLPSGIYILVVSTNPEVSFKLIKE